MAELLTVGAVIRFRRTGIVAVVEAYDNIDKLQIVSANGRTWREAMVGRNGAPFDRLAPTDKHVSDAGAGAVLITGSLGHAWHYFKRQEDEGVQGQQRRVHRMRRALGANALGGP